MGESTARRLDSRPAGLDNLAQLDRAERIAVLRSQMSAMGSTVPVVEDPSSGVSATQVFPGGVIAAPEGMSDLFPSGGLVRRQAVVVQEEPLLVLDFLSQVTAAGGSAAVIGWKDLGLAGLVGAGGVYENLIVIPDPGSEPLNVAAVLCEGLDLVVYRGPKIVLSPVRARPLLGKLRKGTAALMMVGTEVPSPVLRVESSIIGYGGIGQGTGRIRSVEMRVRVLAKGQGPASKTVVVSRPEDAGLLRERGVVPGLRAV